MLIMLQSVYMQRKTNCKVNVACCKLDEIQPFSIYIIDIYFHWGEGANFC